MDLECGERTCESGVPSLPRREETVKNRHKERVPEASLGTRLFALLVSDESEHCSAQKLRKASCDGASVDSVLHGHCMAVSVQEMLNSECFEANTKFLHMHPETHNCLKLAADEIHEACAAENVQVCRLHGIQPPRPPFLNVRMCVNASQSAQAHCSRRWHSS